MPRPIHGIEMRNGVALVYGRSVETATLRDEFLEGAAMDLLARKHRLTPEDVERAIRFECCRTCTCDTCAWASALVGKP